MRVCYLVNVYPAISSSFIRREIRAVEAAGVQVMRVSIRPVPADQLFDPDVRAEQSQTRFLLGIGLLQHIWHMLRLLLRHPLRWLAALRQTISLGWRSDRGLLRNLAYFSEACVLANWLRESDVQHLHAHFGNNPAAVAMLCRTLGGPPYSFTVHGPDEFDRPTGLALGTKVEHAAFVVGISHYTRSQLCRWCDPAHWHKIHVVHCGLDAAFSSATLTPPPAEPHLVSVGRLSEQKGQAILLEAAGQLAAQGVPFKLVIVGDGPMRRTFEKMIAESKLADRVQLVGWQSNDAVRERLRDARVLVLPSFAEGLPVVIMEAFALGRPVITTHIAGIPELVEHGVNGWLIPPASVEALSQAIRESFAASSERLGQMASHGAAKVRKQHDVDTEAAELVRLIDSVARD